MTISKKSLAQILLLPFQKKVLAMLWKDFTNRWNQQKNQRASSFVIQLSHLSGFRILFDYWWYFINHANDKKKWIKRHLVIAGAREIKVNTFIWNFENQKFTKARSDAAD
jgi:hypothetical protein